MQSTVTILKKAVRSGTYASIASTLLLLIRGIPDCGSAIAPVNAVSHWLWKEKAIYKQSSSVRYSASGYCIHHAASIFWLSRKSLLMVYAAFGLGLALHTLLDRRR